MASPSAHPQSQILYLLNFTSLISHSGKLSVINLAKNRVCSLPFLFSQSPDSKRFSQYSFVLIRLKPPNFIIQIISNAHIFSISVYSCFYSQSEQKKQLKSILSILCLVKNITSTRYMQNNFVKGYQKHPFIS